MRQAEQLVKSAHECKLGECLAQREIAPVSLGCLREGCSQRRQVMLDAQRYVDVDKRQSRADLWLPGCCLPGCCLAADLCSPARRLAAGTGRSQGPGSRGIVLAVTAVGKLLVSMRRLRNPLPVPGWRLALQDLLQLPVQP